LALSLIAGERWALPSEPDTVLAIAYLVVLGSVGLFVLVLLVVRRWTASVTSYVFVLFPVVTMIVEAWLLDEPLTLRGISGALVVMAAVWFGALSRPSRGLTQRSPMLPLKEYSAGPTIQATPSRKSTEA
jgi:drug/metabolite transporter (DMT)-like permease